MQTNPLTIELKTGYTDNEGVTHKTVTFGRHITLEDMFQLDESPLNNSETDRALLSVSRSVTSFGTLPKSETLFLAAFLELNEFDAVDLMEGFGKFSDQRNEGRIPDVTSESEIILSVGLEKDGVIYRRVRFGRQITVRDMADADRAGAEDEGLKRQCFLIGRQIASIATEDGSKEIKAPIGLDLLSGLDAATDLPTLRYASLRWRDSFRRQREKVQGADSAQRVDSSV